MPVEFYGDRITLPDSDTPPTKGASSSSSQPHNQSRRSSASTSQAQPIIIDSDDEDWPVQTIINEKAAQGVKNEKSLHRGRASGGGSSRPLDMKAKEALSVQLRELDAEIKSVEGQIRPLQELHSRLVSERRNLEAQLSASSHHPEVTFPSSNLPSRSGTINYQTAEFPFSPAVLQTLKTTFHLLSFRLCQEGVINAAVDNRDIVCVMPTGGGKSLTYQLPAVMGRGLTVVISPLLALIWDQVRALKEIGIECVMMTGATSTSEQNEIYERMKVGGTKHKKEIRLCYVTPEKVSKSKRLISTLEQVNLDGRLRRFVIDEAHCCSQLGHDFRPDYKKLSMLKTLFPRVPIQAVTATLSSKTLPDLLKILRLGPITDGTAAKTTGTVFFSAPLFRPNLHYQVLSKPASSKAAIVALGEWIEAHHPGQSGIIYCLSKKDAETVAYELRTWSNGDIKTGVYHAGIDDFQKERIHSNWREGKVNVICATIAFGLGIDKGDVRYMSKSLEGYYQETGRAGRDGKDSDCVLFFRGQDAARLSSLVYGDTDGSSKLQEMVRFAQDLRTCRKVAFAKYFSASAHLSASAWDHADTLSSSSGAISTCGICDNCRRSPDSIVKRDVTLETWKILKVAQMVQREGGRVTLANLADLVRGLGGGMFGLVGGGEGMRGKRKTHGEKAQLDLEEVGGKVTLGKDDTEALLIHLLLLGYLTDYAVNVYMIASDTAIRLTRLSLDDIQAGKGATVECTFLASPTKKSKGKGKMGKQSAENGGEAEEEDGSEADGANGNGKKRKTTAAKSKGSKVKGRKLVSDEEGNGEGGESGEREWFDLDVSIPDVSPPPRATKARGGKNSQSAPIKPSAPVAKETSTSSTRNPSAFIESDLEDEADNLDEDEGIDFHGGDDGDSFEGDSEAGWDRIMNDLRNSDSVGTMSASKQRSAARKGKQGVVSIISDSE
ncbi:ATP-dependent DNA helicase [Kwoniella heveanensis BCC8398]|uniref:ATP-dependent DNA helicase n=1 Tax=Kwoniella heveanensis BCC8398 TaxID=1296120 RepID=A0A1B9H2H2_9TREE|nr:ATP-dependent DNA helicase [Kwoniella heveanensis BCC8398]